VRRPELRDTANARRWGETIAQAISWSLPFGNDPLIVFSAGNYGGTAPGGDARLNGREALLARHPNRIIAVGAVEHAPGHGDFGSDYRLVTWSSPDPAQHGSSWGHSVEIVAPGKDVGILRVPEDVTSSGTSVAAPAVSGAAVLMLSLDPTLTASELKTLLLQGAEEGGVAIDNRVSSVHMLNVYRSLRLVANRAGAGLCGNPIWQANDGSVYAVRGGNWASGTAEYLFTEAGIGLSHQHRTKKVGFTNGNAWRHTGSGWVADTILGPLDNASHLSRWGHSHDQDTVVTVSRDKVNQFLERFHVSINGNEIVVIDGPAIRQPPTPYPQRCVVWETSGTEFDSCLQTQRHLPDFRTTNFYWAYSSARQEILLAIARDSSAWRVENGEFFYGGYMQRNYSYETYTHDTHLYYIPVADPAAYRHIVTPNFRFSDLAFSEDGSHLALRSASMSVNNITTPMGFNFNTAITCGVHFRDVRDVSLPVVFFTTAPSNTMVCSRNPGFASGAGFVN
jgi:hypothetical protein